MGERWQRIADLAAAIRLKRTALDPVLAWSREQLEAFQEKEWRAIARRAAARAPFYRELYRGIDLERAPLSALPPVDKEALMERFDETVTDPALRLGDLEAHLRAGDAHALFAGRFQVLVTSGTTGRRGVFVFDRPEWQARIAAALRCQALSGNRPRPYPRLRMATFTSTHPHHISARLARAADVGLYRRIAIDPQEPLEQVLPRLEAFGPEVLFGYPSVILPIAQAQMDGRLRIRPRRVVAGAEAVTPAFREAVRSAWGCETFDLYATTETGALAAEGAQHDGLYLMEDLAIVEVVDEQERPVPDGEPGHHLLVTCLSRWAQPLIRYRISDQLVIDPPRKLPFRRIRAIDGRVRDSLRLVDFHGAPVELRPSFLLAGLLSLPGIRQVQVIQEPDLIRVLVVGEEALPSAVETWFRTIARERNLRLPPVLVGQVARLGGTDATLGKFRPVECRLPSVTIR
jgi:phenylacetate-coenzyme A ligase PaaK-like adenylate-forming protein